MAFAVPLIGAFAAAGGTIAGVGAALTGAAGFASFASVAGGLMAGAGMLTGNKALTKVGSVLGLAGIATSLVSKLADTAANAAMEGAANDALASSAGDKIAKDAVTESLKSEMANAPVGQLGQAAGDAGAQTLGQAGQAATTGGAPLSLNATDPYVATVGQPGQNLLEQMSERLSQAPQVTGGLEQATADGTTGFMQSVEPGGPGYTDPKLAQAGQEIPNQNALQTMLDKVGAAGKAAGKWVKDNKELAMFGGQILQGGMQAYQQGQQFDQQMNLIEQRRRRLNSPVVLGIQAPQLKTYTPGG